MEEKVIQDYKVYIKTDDAGNITAVNSSAFLDDVTGWTEIDSGIGDKYHHAQNNYFEQPLTESGVYRYKFDGQKAVKKVLTELQSEIEAKLAEITASEEKKRTVEQRLENIEKVLDKLKNSALLSKLFD